MSPMLRQAYCHLNQQHSLWAPDEGAFQFVMQEHEATHHHFDFSLQINEIFITWAIRGGLSLNPRVQQKAVESGIHGKSTKTAERFIPAGQKGSGPKISWDLGMYRPEGLDFRSVLDALRMGFLRFELFGEKLKGKWTLKRDYNDRWILNKTADEFASEADVMLLDHSVLSGRRLRDLDVGPVASVHVDGFYASQHPTDKPVVIFHENHVLDCNGEARSRRVLPGMTAREAKNILASGEFILWNPDEYAERQKAWLDVCVQFSDVVQPSQQHTAYVDLSLHPQPVQTAQELKAALEQTIQLPASVGVAKAKWVADLAVGQSDSERAVENAAGFIADLPVSMLAPVPPEIQNKLLFLGYSTIGEVAKIPFTTLEEQFGPYVFTITQAARGSYCEPVKADYPQDSLIDRFVFAGAVESSEVIREACKEWAQRIGRKLQKKSVGGSKVWLALELESGEIKILTRTFAKPVLCHRSALAALLLTLDGQIEQPILSIRLRIMELKQVNLYQPNLFETSKLDQRIKPALNHVRTVFGDHSIELGSQREEPRRVRVLREWKHATGWQ